MYRLRQELVEVKKRHEEEIKSLRQEQEESLMHWKSLAAHQTEQKAIIDRLHETQLYVSHTLTYMCIQHVRCSI